jgi:hypothetical protein
VAVIAAVFVFGGLFLHYRSALNGITTSNSESQTANAYSAFSTPSNATIVPFSFTLSANATTSAGVYTTGGVLIKTLWSGVPYIAGSHSAAWDGTGDDGRLVTPGNYSIRVLSNNVSYTWEGVIGNTSDSFSGSTVYHSYSRMYDMAFSSTTGYYSIGYEEANSSEGKFSTSDPQSKTWILQSGGTSQATYFVATDGTTVYWGGQDAFNPASSFVFGTLVSTDAQASFANSTSVATVHGITYWNAIDALNAASSTITGMAVQKAGQYLFVARGGLNKIDIVNKTTGALVQSMPFTSVSFLAVDASDNLWVTYVKNGSPIIQKYSVGSTGTLTVLGPVITGLVSPLALAVSPDNTTVLVADGGSSQQLKAFSNSTASSTWVYGQAGGYASDPAVTNNKFYWSDTRSVLGTFIAYAPDGSFWVEDSGNSRAEHFSANRTYIEDIMYLPNSYSSFVDPNNPTRVFSDYLEFQVDYSKPLAPNNGSWTLVRNWGYSVPANLDDQYNRLRSVVTLNNGHTYALLHDITNGNNGSYEVVELPASGQLRFTGVYTPSFHYQIYPDGSIRSSTAVTIGAPTVWTERLLTGFDSSNNPLWGTETTIASSPPATNQDPVYYGNGVVRYGEITSSGVVASFDNGLPPNNGGSGYHLGGIKTGTNTWLWRVAPSTFPSYGGPYPTDGAYDIGNNVQYAGSVALAMDRSIFWGYHGEFWKNTEANEWDQVYDDGLFIGQFGTNGALSGAEASPGMAGNAFSPSLVKDAAGDVYLYHNDESVHGGVHRWKITGLNTIQEQSIPVTFSPTAQGLLGQYYDGADVDNVNIKTIRIDPGVSFAWGSTTPANTNLSNPANFSVRWTGFVKPASSGSYTFYVDANSGVRLWVDGNLIIDQWNGNAQAEYSGSATLTGGIGYPIRLEYENTSNAPSVSLSWSGGGLTKQIIPASSLLPAPAPDISNGFNLMEGLPFNSVLQDGIYGWHRNPATENHTDSNSNWWEVQTNNQSYNATWPDVFAWFRQNSGTYTVTRDLGTVSPQLTSWDLSGIVSYVGNYENTDGGGSYIEVLDSQGKVITRLFTSVWYATHDAYMYGNSYSTTLGGALIVPFENITNVPQPFDIHMANGAVTFTYGPYAPISTSALVDPTSNWTHPATLVLSFYGNNSNYDRKIDLQNVRFLSLPFNPPSITVALPPDTTPPVITSFALAAVWYSGGPYTLPLTFTASDDTAVTGYLVSESSSTPTASDPRWTATAPTSYTFATFSGQETLYAWAKDAAGNVSSTSVSNLFLSPVHAQPVGPSDTTPPTILSFVIPATATSLTVPIISFTASDNIAVTGYMLTELSNKPATSSPVWQTTAPARYTFSGSGAKTLYAWAKDAAGNISSSRNATTVITLPAPCGSNDYSSSNYPCASR